MSEMVGPVEPVAVQVTRYRCPFCTRGWSSKKRATDHVTRCWHNPDARNCKTCIHFESYRWTSEPLGGGWACTERDEECAVEVDISEGLRSGCPLWILK